MKKKLVVLLCGIVMVSIAGCGVSKSSSGVENETSINKTSENESSANDESQNPTKPSLFDGDYELDDRNSAKVPIAIFDSNDYEHKADSFKNVGYLRIPNECVVDFAFVDENGNRDSELSGHDKAVHTLGEWNSVKECKDNGDFDKDYVYIGTFSKADNSDAVMISPVIYTQEECDVYLNGKTFKSYLDDEIKEGGESTSKSYYGE